jgi:hypothetical protein
MRTLVVLLCFASCFSPAYDEGGFICGPGGSCPSPQTCRFDNHCWAGVGPALPAPIEPDAGAADVVEVEVPVEHAPIIRQLGESCSPMYVGLENRSDDCAIGLVCVQGNRGSSCFRLCAGGENRAIDPGPGGPVAMVCPLSPVACDRVSDIGCQPGWACYRQSGIISCDPQSGGQRLREACTYSRDCLPGLALECVSGYCAVTQ